MKTAFAKSALNILALISLLSSDQFQYSRFSTLDLVLCQYLHLLYIVGSVADPGCLSRILDLGCRILDPKTATKQRGKKISCHTFFVEKNFTKLKIILFLKWWRIKFWPIFKEYRTLLKKLSLNSQKYGFGIRNPQPGIRKKPIPDPGSRDQKGTGSRIPKMDPQHWL